MPTTVDGKPYLSIKEAAKALGQNEHYVRQLTLTYTRDTFAIAGGMKLERPGGIENIQHQEGASVRRLIPVEAIEAYKARSAASGRASVDGKKPWKFRLSSAQLEALKSGTLSKEDQLEMVATIKSGSNYNAEYSKKRRMRLKAESANGADEDEDEDDGDEGEEVDE